MGRRKLIIIQTHCEMRATRIKQCPFSSPSQCRLTVAPDGRYRGLEHERRTAPTALRRGADDPPGGGTDDNHNRHTGLHRVNSVIGCRLPLSSGASHAIPTVVSTASPFVPPRHPRVKCFADAMLTTEVIARAVTAIISTFKKNARAAPSGRHQEYSRVLMSSTISADR